MDLKVTVRICGITQRSIFNWSDGLANTRATVAWLVQGGCGIIARPAPIIEVWCNGSTPTRGVGFVAIDAREESHGVTLLKYPETSIIGDGYLFVSNATRLKNIQSAL